MSAVEGLKRKRSHESEGEWIHSLIEAKENLCIKKFSPVFIHAAFIEPLLSLHTFLFSLYSIKKASRYRKMMRWFCP